MGYTSIFDKWKKDLKKEIDNTKTIEELIRLLRKEADRYADWLEDNPHEKTYPIKEVGE